MRRGLNRLPPPSMKSMEAAGWALTATPCQRSLRLVMWRRVVGLLGGQVGQGGSGAGRQRQHGGGGRIGRLKLGAHLSDARRRGRRNLRRLRHGGRRRPGGGNGWVGGL